MGVAGSSPPAASPAGLAVQWQATLERAGLIAVVPDGLDRHRPHLHYLLLDEGR